MNTSSLVTLALSKGRILEDTIPLLKQAGVNLLDDPLTSRKLIFTTSMASLRIVIVRATDVPTYVQYGGADLGITGKDTLIEHGEEGLYQLKKLDIAQCRLSVAVHEQLDFEAAAHQGNRMVVATKYPKVAREYFANRGMHIDLIKLYGSMELAPLVGMADAIVDLVSTGNTLKANHLKEVDKIKDICSYLVANPTSLKLKCELLTPIINIFSSFTQK